MSGDERVAVPDRDRDDRERQRRHEAQRRAGAAAPAQVAVPVPTGRGAHDAGRVSLGAERPPMTPPPLDAVARWEERAAGPGANPGIPPSGARVSTAERSSTRRREPEARRRAPDHVARVATVTPTAGTALTVSTPSDAREVAARRAADLADRPARGPPTNTVTSDHPGRSPPVAALADAAPGRAGGSARSVVPSSVRHLVASPGPGTPVPDAVARHVEPLLATDVSAVRVHQDRRTHQAAADLGARAFTVGTHVYLGAGQSTTDVPLLAHELTHAVQPGTAGIVHRDVLGIDTAARDAIAAEADTVPGYTLLTLLIRYDPIRGRHVEPTAERVVRGVIGLVPFGTAIYDRLSAGNLVQRVLDLVTGGLLAHNLTLARIQREIDTAWDEIHLVDGISANLAVVARHVDAVIRDVTAFAGDLVDGILALVRELAVGMAEPLLTGPTIGPVWEVAKKVLHHDPLRDTPVVATTEEILEDLLRLLGQGDKIEQLRERGVITRVAGWIDANVGRVTSLVDELRALFAEAWNAIQPSNIADLPASLEHLVTRAGELLGRVRAFAEDLIAQALSLVKESLLHWLSEHAHHARGFRLVTVLIGKDPFTQEEVPLTPANLIGGFIGLLPDGENTFHQLEESGVIAEASGRIETAAATLGISWTMITGTFRAIWDSLHLEDLLHPLDTFERIVGAFGEPLGRIIAFVSTVVQVVVELILRLMNFPSDLLASIIEHVTSAIDAIRDDPVRFLLNMLEALKRGVLSFVDHIVTHLLNGLSSWLFRGLRQMGITPPAEVSVQSVITLVLQVLGLSMDLVWAKLEERLGAETVGRIRGAIGMLSGAWSFVKDVQERGITAIWEFIQGQLSNLWDTILTAAQTWIQERIVSAVVEKLISMLDPTGIMAVVNSFLAFFRAVQSLIDYIRDVLEVVNEYVTTLDEVAHGNVDPAAQKVEHGLSMAVPMAIGFLANQVGIGAIPEKVVEIVQSIRGVVEQAVAWLIDQAITLGRSALAALGIGGGTAAAAPAADPTQGADLDIVRPVTLRGHQHEVRFEEHQGRVHVLLASSVPTLLRTRLDLARGHPALSANPQAQSGLAELATELEAAEQHAAVTAHEAGVSAGRQLSGEQWYRENQRLAAVKVERIAQTLNAIGLAFDISDLREPEYLMGGRVRDGVNIRETFYGRVSNPAGVARQLLSAQLRPSPARATGAPTTANYWECPGADFATPHVTTLPLEIEHRTAVVTHWNAMGRLTTQTTRVAWNNDMTNLKGMCQPHNLQKEADRRREEGNAVREVGPQFEGPPARMV